MKRAVAVLGASAVAIGLSAAPAGADVHAISQAGCAAEGAPSGAQESRDAPGRPDAPIPVTASGFTLATFPGQGGDGDPACDVPPGPPQS